MAADPSKRQELVAAALAVRQQAYSPYSKFLVGAAILGGDGKIYAGCNVENASYGLTICAERGVACAAVSAGCRQFQLLALATHGGHLPCGACRQVLAEFAPELPILIVDVDRPGKIKEANLRDLLPGSFQL